ncbi:MAG: hypothetical protein WCH43_05960 [Verrucomicrobiota bacterium]
MKSRGPRARTLRRVKYIIYVTAALLAAALMFYLNLKRERKLLLVQQRRLLVQEQFDSDPRFKGISTGIDRGMQVSTITGSVATPDDYRELTKKLSKIPPFPGTFNWRIDVEIRNPERVGR